MTIHSDKAVIIPCSPFHPTLGRSPAVISGYDAELDSSELALAESPGNPWRTALISGTRGIGRTVLLGESETAARQLGWTVLCTHIGSEMISKLTDVTIPRVFSATDSAPVGKGHHLASLSIASIGGFKTEVSTPQPEPGRNLLSQLRDLSAPLMPQESDILLTLDEVQSAGPAQFNKIAHVIQGLSCDDAEIAFVAAGLLSGIGDLFQLEGAAFLHHARRVSLDRLDLETTKGIIRRTTELGEYAMIEDAVELASGPSHGYPYLIQTIGSVTWAKTRLARSDTITAQHVSDTVAESVRRIGPQVHAPSPRKVPPRRIVLFKAMARLSPNGKPVTTSAIVRTMERKFSDIS